MKNIAKWAEPNTLTQHRSVDPTDYDGYRDKQALRESLWGEQRGICCYCMGRIHPDVRSMKIEHWQSQSIYPQDRLVYSNLLGACLGGDGEGKRRTDQHCDTFKGDSRLSRSPANFGHNVEALIRYPPDGSVEASEPEFNGQLDTVLNLNLAFLKSNRQSVLHAFQQTLTKRGTLSKARWESLLAKWEGDSGTQYLEPYCGVVIYWIRKKLARL